MTMYGISPSEFYSQDSEKNKLNWFCYELALTIFQGIDKKTRRRLRKKKIDETELARFSVYYAKHMKGVVLRKLAGEIEQTIISYVPIESFFPGRARAIAEKRIEQLTAAGGNIAVMCPICLVNLRHAAKRRNYEVKDISQYLVDAYCGEHRVTLAEPAAV